MVGAGALLTLLAAFGVAGSIHAVDARPPAAGVSSALRDVADQTQAWSVAHGDVPVLLSGAPFDGFRWGLVEELAWRGVPVETTRADTFYFGSWMRRRHGSHARTLLVLSGPAARLPRSATPTGQSSRS